MLKKIETNVSMYICAQEDFIINFISYICAQEDNYKITSWCPSTGS